MAESETKMCGNCKRQIAASNFMMHEMHCRRHISLCQFCKEPIPKGEMEVHVEESHAKIACQRCGIQVEKMDLEDHEENSCEKRPQKCLYCELEFPKNELTDHTDYCGSRTEQCAKCSQFIMLKDQLKHEESNCAFPPIKPANNNNRNSTDIDPIRDRPLNIYGHSRKRHNRNELDRAVGGQSFVGGLDIPPYVPLVSTKDGERGERASRTNVFNNGRIGRNVNTKVGVKKSDLNKMREAAASGQSAGEENDIDHLLAMHLAQDLHQDDDDLDELIRQMEKPEPSMPVTQSLNPTMEMNRFSEDLSLIPCEFCGEPCLADDLVQHQSACSLDRISAMLPQMSAAVSRGDGLNNTAETSQALIEKPPIIDNLRNFSAEDWLDDTDPVGASEEDSMLLPCEFCNELFPMDILVQHQAVCDSNTSMTPRVQSPAISKPRLAKKKTSSITNTKLTNLDRLEADLPNLTSRRHQAPPGILHLDPDSDDDLSAGTTHRVLKPNIGSRISPASNIRKVSKGYGIEAQDRGDYVTRQRVNPKNPRSSGDENVTRRSDLLQNKQRTGSDVRTRATLDTLLRDADESAHDLLGNIPVGGRKTVKNDVNSSRQKVSASTNAVPQLRGVPKSKPTTVARDIHRDTNSYSTQSSTGATRNRTRAVDEPPFEIRTRPVDIEERNQPQRTRPTRANNVFGNQPRQQKRRTDNS